MKQPEDNKTKEINMMGTAKAVFVRNPYNYDMNKASDETALECKDKTLTQQQFAAECDINNLVERFKITGELPKAARQPQFADFEGVFDYQSALNAVRAAEESFAEMPAKVRSRFENDPNRFVNFVADPENREEAAKLGLVNKPLPQKAPAIEPEAKKETDKTVT